MKILLHASLDLVETLANARDCLTGFSGIEVITPDLRRYQAIRDVDGDDPTFTQIKYRLALEAMRNLELCDCLLILNFDHRGVENYIGGNSFLEMAVAFYLRKPIFIMNPIPVGLPYTEEIAALRPTIIGALSFFEGYASTSPAQNPARS